jgi:rubredoxin
MEQRFDPSPAYRPPCPSCRAGTGRPVEVSIQRQQKTIAYRCHFCEHTWNETHPEPHELFSPVGQQLTLS